MQLSCHELSHFKECKVTQLPAVLQSADQATTQEVDLKIPIARCLMLCSACRGQVQQQQSNLLQLKGIL